MSAACSRAQFVAPPSSVTFLTGAANVTYSSSNRKIRSTSTWQTVPTSIQMPSSGKVYLEFYTDPPSGSSGPMIGVMQGSAIVSGSIIGALPSNPSASVGISTTRADGAGWSVSLAGHVMTSAGVIGVAVDIGLGIIRWYSAGVMQTQSEALFPANSQNMYFAVSSHPLYGGVEIAQSSANTPSGYTYFTG